MTTQFVKSSYVSWKTGGLIFVLVIIFWTAFQFRFFLTVVLCPLPFHTLAKLSGPHLIKCSDYIILLSCKKPGRKFYFWQFSRGFAGEPKRSVNGLLIATQAFASQGRTHNHNSISDSLTSYYRGRARVKIQMGWVNSCTPVGLTLGVRFLGSIVLSLVA